MANQASYVSLADVLECANMPTMGISARASSLYKSSNTSKDIKIVESAWWTSKRKTEATATWLKDRKLKMYASHQIAHWSMKDLASYYYSKS